MNPVEIPESKASRFLFANTSISWIWFVVRIYIGHRWIVAGWEKLQSPMWIGSKAGTALRGFLMGALQKTTGQHPDVSGWYAYFIQHIVLPHSVLFSFLVTFGELAVGIALILGLFTGIAAFFGMFMNFNYLLAGTVSMNPMMFLLQLFLILSWRTAGWLGIDYYLLSTTKIWWQKRRLFSRNPTNPT